METPVSPGVSVCRGDCERDEHDVQVEVERQNRQQRNRVGCELDRDLREVDREEFQGRNAGGHRTPQTNEVAHEDREGNAPIHHHDGDDLGGEIVPAGELCNSLHHNNTERPFVPLSSRSEGGNPGLRGRRPEFHVCSFSLTQSRIDCSR